jgi:phage terminase Nu1 subunit (DNA packaging protein)
LVKVPQTKYNTVENIEYKLDTKTLSEDLGVESRYIRRLVSDGIISKGVIKKGKSYKFNLEITREELSAHAQNTNHGTIYRNLLEESESQPGDEEDPENMSFTDAKKIEQVYKAKLSRLKFEKESGKLIEKSAVHKELFNIGSGIREAILGVPGRCIDNVLAAETRRGALKIIYDELADALELLTGAPDKFIKKFGELEEESDNE